MEYDGMLFEGSKGNPILFRYIHPDERINELKIVSGKTIDELIGLFKNGKITIKEPLFKVGDKFQFKDVEFDQLVMGEPFARIKLYNPIGCIVEIGSDGRYRVQFGYERIVEYTYRYHEDYLKELKKIN